MCELFGLSSNNPVELADALTAFGKRGGETADNPDGWGLAYLAHISHHPSTAAIDASNLTACPPSSRLDVVSATPSPSSGPGTPSDRRLDALATMRGEKCGLEHGHWQLHKAAEAAAHSEQYAKLAQDIRSRLLIAHVRKANPPSAHTSLNTHPFVRGCCGRSWVFAHNGKVPEVIQPQGCCYPEHSTPLGETDSEHAFYFLLDEIASAFTNAEADNHNPWLQKLATLSEDIAAHGQFNFLMSDGIDLIAYGHDRLHVLERSNNTSNTVMISSEPLTDEPWQSFKNGELRIYREGVLRGCLTTQPIATTATDDTTEKQGAKQ